MIYWLPIGLVLRHATLRLQVRKIIIYLLRTQLPEPGSMRALDALVAKQVVCRGPDNADFYGISAHLALDLRGSLARRGGVGVVRPVPSP